MMAHQSKYVELQDSIKSDGRFFTATGKLNTAFLRREYFQKSVLHSNIHDATCFLPESATISERIYCIYNNILQQPVCICGKVLKFITNTQGYLKSCSKCIRKVGNTWKTSSDTARKNITKEHDELEQYILDSTSAESSFEDVCEFIKSKTTNIAESIKWISRDDMRNKKAILKKIISLTNYLKLDINNYNWSNRIYNIFYNTHNGKLCDICKTNKTRYKNFLQGYSACCSKRECVQMLGCSNRVVNHMTTILPTISAQGFDINQSEFRGLNYYDKMTLFCRNCNTNIEYNLANGNWKSIRCYTCYGDTSVSYEEKEVLKLVKEHVSDVRENYRLFANSTKEVDIYIPHKKLAIEYNGSIWHSFGTTYPNNIDRMAKSKNNHYKKYEMCKSSDVKLLQINSHEWNNRLKKDIWKSMIVNHLGKSTKIDARKCTVAEVSTTDKNNFLSKNHLQGIDNSSVKIGLIYNNEIVSVMTFAQPRFNKKYQWELVRFCNKLNHRIVGGASKLINYFIKKYNPKDIISYADLKYSDGSLYKALGFKFIRYTPPSYVYIKGERVVSRYTAQKHKLSKLLKSFDAQKTELQNMLDAGYRRLWDAGNMLFVLET